MGPNEVHLMVLRELAGEGAKPLPIIFEKSWQIDKAPSDWKMGEKILIFKKGKRENLGNNRAASLTSVAGKITEQILLETMLKAHGKQRGEL